MAVHGGEPTEDKAWRRGPVVGVFVVLAILCAIILGFIHRINLIDVTHLTGADFRNHPAPGALILDKKRVQVSKGPLFDAFLWLNLRCTYSPAGRGHAKYSSLRISTEEMRRRFAKYALFEWNGTVYGVVQSA
ncbi:hypothetical protein [Methanoculleus sp.]|uniref:hypothetical protein n=1 Tax=Methanoculleus sp. TaxID=90427 RepID=UPI001BD5A461|nr:hypothetical protein [Methanoculleus sp.]